jgi:lipopolysaccharide export system permease protein
VTLERIEGQQLYEKLTATRIMWDTATSKWTLLDWQLRTLKNNTEEIENEISWIHCLI